MSEYELYDLALYGAVWRRDECKRTDERAEYDRIIAMLEKMLVMAELKMEGICS